LTGRHRTTCTSTSRRYAWRLNPQANHLRNPKNCPTAWGHFSIPTRPTNTIKGLGERSPGPLCFRGLRALHRDRKGAVDHQVGP
jgi:hypothetical protein